MPIDEAKAVHRHVSPAGLALIWVGGVTLVGWLFGVPRVLFASPVLHPVGLDAAFSVLALGTGLLFPRVRRVAAAVALMTGGMQVLADLLHMFFDWQLWSLRPWNAYGQPYSVPMSLPGAVCVLCGGALLLTLRRWLLLGMLTVLVVCSIGYVWDVPFLLTWGGQRQLPPIGLALMSLLLEDRWRAYRHENRA